MKTFDYELSEPIEYSHKGELVSGSKITLYAPKPNQRRKTAMLKQMFFQSLPKPDPDSKPNENKTDSEIDGNAVLFIIAQSQSDYAEFIELGRSIICDKNAKIDDVEYLTVVTADKLEFDALEDMIGQYVANFIVKSSLSRLSKS